jgi:hypothetical protein
MCDTLIARAWPAVQGWRVEYEYVRQCESVEGEWIDYYEMSKSLMVNLKTDPTSLQYLIDNETNHVYQEHTDGSVFVGRVNQEVANAVKEGHIKSLYFDIPLLHSREPTLTEFAANGGNPSETKSIQTSLVLARKSIQTSLVLARKRR